MYTNNEPTLLDKRIEKFINSRDEKYPELKLVTPYAQSPFDSVATGDENRRVVKTRRIA